ncbi:MAG: transposase [Bacteroidetes bacterium]|nr:transposase [Bacteroidota bacterium]
MKVSNICRNHGSSDSAFYNWKSEYSGMTLNDLMRLKELEYENARLKRLYADLSLENEVLKDIVSKKF